ncbi:MAG: hypothetical protein GYA20_03435 [Chloroflexi bacterium]|nr:hypothetical protein [Chloroflexota bacterium]
MDEAQVIGRVHLHARFQAAQGCAVSGEKILSKRIHLRRGDAKHIPHIQVDPVSDILPDSAIRRVKGVIQIDE